MKKFWHAHNRDLTHALTAHASGKASRFAKKTLAVTLIAVGAVAFVPAVHANVFDPLLKVLLPFYNPVATPKADSTPDTAATTDTHADTATHDEEAVLAVPDTGDDAFDTLNTDAPQAAPKHAFSDTAHPDVPAILLSDTLVAGDTLPMLDTPDLYALLDAEFAADRGDVERALTIYKAESFKNNATSVFERALSLSIEFEQPADSLAFATAWQDANPEHIPAWFYVTHLALKAGEYNQAASMISMILHYDPRADLGQILNGIIPTNPDDKRALLYALQDLGQNNASISVLRAGILMGLNEYDAARLHVNQALSLEPKNLAFITLKLDILRASNRMDELWTYLHKMRKQLPKEKDLYLYEIRYLIEKGELSRAWTLLAQANKNTNDPDIRLLSGLVGLDSARYADAISVLEPLLEHPTLASQAHYYMGIGYERLGDVQNARRHYEQVTHYENVLDARTKVVGFYLAENNIDAAIATLTRLRDEFESYAPDSYILQAEIYLSQGDKAHAKDLLTIANRDYPNDDRLLYASFKLLEDELEPEDKRQAIAKLLEIDEFNPDYQLADAKFRLSQDSHDKDALEIAERISNISFDDPEYDSQRQLDALLALANAALANQQYDTVIDYLQAPYDVMPTLDVGIVLLRAYQGLGDTQMVTSLLADLQTRFGVGQANSTDSQIY